LKDFIIVNYSAVLLIENYPRLTVT